MREIVSENVLEPSPNIHEDSAPEFEDTDFSEAVEDLEGQLEHNVAALFLKMSSILNISENVLQEVLEQINHIYLLSKPLLNTSVQRILNQHCGDVDSLVRTRVAAENNVFLRFTSTGGSLSTANK